MVTRTAASWGRHPDMNRGDAMLTWRIYIESYIVPYVMSAITTPKIDREQLLDYVSSHLLQRASLLSRLLVRRSGHAFSRTEGGVLSTLTAGPRRITELAELEGLAQPSMTLLARRLERRGWVERGRQPDDARVVVISITEAGATALEQFRSRYRGVLRAHIGTMSDEQLAALEHATETLGSLVHALQGGSRA
jgi:DNA-binding MarR family transcriptional regulator